MDRFKKSLCGKAMQEKDTIYRYSTILGRNYTREELKEIEKSKEPQKNLEEACFKYVKATYGLSELPKNGFCLMDALLKDDSILFAFKKI